MNFTPTEEPQWYVVHTYSGYENKVKDGIDAAIEHRGLQDMIKEVRVPTREVVEKKDGKIVISEKKLFPGYIMINMIMSDDAWYVIRNTRGVTGFVGPGAKPIPLSQEEIRSMGLLEPKLVSPFSEGETIMVSEGPLKNFSGIIDKVFPGQSKVRVNLNMFGRQTPTELEFDQIEKIPQQ